MSRVVFCRQVRRRLKRFGAHQIPHLVNEKILFANPKCSGGAMLQFPRKNVAIHISHFLRGFLPFASPGADKLVAPNRGKNVPGTAAVAPPEMPVAEAKANSELASFCSPLAFFRKSPSPADHSACGGVLIDDDAVSVVCCHSIR